MEKLTKLFLAIRNKYLILLVLIAFAGLIGLWALDAAVVTVAAVENLNGDYPMFNGLGGIQAKQAYRLSWYLAVAAICLLVTLNLVRDQPLVFLVLTAFAGILALRMLDTAVVTVIATDHLNVDYSMFNGLGDMQIKQAYHLGLYLAASSIMLLTVFNLARRE